MLNYADSYLIIVVVDGFTIWLVYLNSQTLMSVLLAIIPVSKYVWTLREGSGVNAGWGLNWPTPLTVEASLYYGYDYTQVNEYSMATTHTHTHTHTLQTLMSVARGYITVSRPVSTLMVDSTVAALTDFSFRVTWGPVRVSLYESANSFAIKNLSLPLSPLIFYSPSPLPPSYPPPPPPPLPPPSHSPVPCLLLLFL